MITQIAAIERLCAKHVAGSRGLRNAAGAVIVRDWVESGMRRHFLACRMRRRIGVRGLVEDPTATLPDDVVAALDQQAAGDTAAWFPKLEAAFGRLMAAPAAHHRSDSHRPGELGGVAARVRLPDQRPRAAARAVRPLAGPRRAADARARHADQQPADPGAPRRAPGARPSSPRADDRRGVLRHRVAGPARADPLRRAADCEPRAGRPLPEPRPARARRGRARTRFRPRRAAAPRARAPVRPRSPRADRTRRSAAAAHPQQPVWRGGDLTMALALPAPQPRPRGRLDAWPARAPPRAPGRRGGRPARRDAGARLPAASARPRGPAVGEDGLVPAQPPRPAGSPGERRARHRGVDPDAGRGARLRHEPVRRVVRAPRGPQARRTAGARPGVAGDRQFRLDRAAGSVGAARRRTARCVLSGAVARPRQGRCSAQACSV